ncbi:hypothetical protein EOD23_01230 [Mesorhizobium sp. USDA-HM6]|nr:hypothetical protein EOD23_01230 [Mesorhizobium sp. USDA-HM6]
MKKLLQCPCGEMPVKIGRAAWFQANGRHGGDSKMSNILASKHTGRDDACGIDSLNLEDVLEKIEASHRRNSAEKCS